MIKWYSRRGYCNASAGYKPAGCLKNAAGIKKKSGVKGKCHWPFQKGSVLKWPQTTWFRGLYLIPVLCVLLYCSQGRRGGVWSGERAEGRLEFLMISTSRQPCGGASDRELSPFWQAQGDSYQGLEGMTIWAVITIQSNSYSYLVLWSLLSSFICLSSC